jgi:hypothetical protein
VIYLSHTAKEKYLQCPLAYYMHYILRLRERVLGSALPFGSAIDEGAGALAEGKTLDEALKVFDDAWTNPEINGVVVDGPTTDLIRFSKADSVEGLADTPWESLKIKGHMLIKAYQKEVMPLFKDVLAVQHKIELDNETGDKIVGYIDKIVELKTGEKVLFDDKTSSQKYPSDIITNVDGPSVDKAKQLALYYTAAVSEFGLNKVGFIVMEKKIRSKEPRHRIQVLTGNIPESIIDKTFDEFNQVLYNIRMGKFPSNHPNCDSYYGKCICHEYVKSDTMDTERLIRLKDKYVR